MGVDTRRGTIDKGFMWVRCRFVAPAQDSQRAAGSFGCEVGVADPWVPWLAVRQDTLLDGEVTEHAQTFIPSPTARLSAWKR